MARGRKGSFAKFAGKVALIALAVVVGYDVLGKKRAASGGSSSGGKLL